MCGRAYQTYTQEELALRYLNEKPLHLPDFKPNYNFSPTQNSPVLIHLPNHELQFKLFRWGLIPHWFKDGKSAYKMINARSETVTEKPSFREAIQHRRCILPLTGFYEWKRDGETKRPFAIFLKNEGPHAKSTLLVKAPPIMSVAGIWETWIDPAASKIHTFSILTTAANSMMRPIHDRMPIILAPDTEKEWLDPGLKDPVHLQKFLKACPSDWLEAYEIAPLVNNPRNNTADLLKQLNS